MIIHSIFMLDNFFRRKNQQFSKPDKSIKNKWDSKIVKLCNRINSKEIYYTTSSCSGRILLIKKSNIKKDGLFVKVWHDLISFKELKETLESIDDEGIIYFKQEPVILHIACRTLQDAQALIDIAVKKAGWKRYGIISSRRFILELNSTEKLEFPIMDKGRILIDNAFLETIVKEANEKIKLSWDKINRFEKEMG